MPSGPCKKCGKTTNSVLSNWWDRSGSKELGVVTECYAAWDDDEQKWIKGCSYDLLGNDKYSLKHYVDKLIKKGG